MSYSLEAILSLTSDFERLAVLTELFKVPKTVLGKWSVGLLVAFILLFALFQDLVASGQRGGAGFFDKLVLAIPGILMAVCGIAAFLAGFTSIVNNKERALTVFLASLLGLLVLVFVLGEIFFPH